MGTPEIVKPSKMQLFINYYSKMLHFQSCIFNLKRIFDMSESDDLSNMFSNIEFKFEFNV